MNRLLALVSFTILAIACDGKGTNKPALGDGGTTNTPDSKLALDDGGTNNTPDGKPDLGDVGAIPATTPQEFFDRFLDALCAWAARCGSYEDAATCQEFLRNTTIISFEATIQSINQGRTIHNPSKEAACLESIANLPCSEDALDSDPFAAGCANVLVGTIAAGGECIEDFECKPGLACDPGSCTASCCAGVCATKKPLTQVGESCTSSTCVPAAYCKQTYNATTKTVEGTCQPRAALDAACTGIGSCVSGAECVGSTGSLTCVAKAKDGDPCGTAGCENFTSFCDPVKGTCGPRLKENAACMLPDVGPAPSFAAGCFGSYQCKDGVCKKLPVAGQPCSNPDGAALDECVMVGACVNGFCQAREPQPVCTVAVAKTAAADAGARD